MGGFAGVLHVLAAFLCISKVLSESLCGDDSGDARNSNVTATPSRACGPGMYTVEIVHCGNSSYHCADCPKGFYSDAMETGYCTTCPSGRFANQKAQTVCDGCPLGATSNAGEHTCRLCEAGTRRERHDSSVCEPCPPGSDCTRPGTARPINIANYWVQRDPATNTSTFLPCFKVGDCLVGEQCAQGSVGPLCAVCLPGYVRTVKGCSECPATSSTTAVLCLAGFGFLFAIYFVASKNAKSAGKKKSLSASLIKLFIGYLTTISVVFPIFTDVAVQERRQYLLHPGQGGLRTYDEVIMTVAHVMEMLSIFSWLDLLSSLVVPACLVEPALTSDQVQLINSLSNLSHSADPPPSAAQALHDHHVHWEMYMLLASLLTPVVMILIGITCGLVALCFVLYRRRCVLHAAFEFYERVGDLGEFAAAAEEFHSSDVKSFLSLYTERWLGIWSLTRLWRAKRRPCAFLREFFRDAAPLYVVSTFFLYPFMVRASLRPVRCVELAGHIRFAPEPNDLRIETSADVVCQDKTSTIWWISGVAMPVAAVGVQALLFLLLHLNAADAHNPRVQRTWNFLTAGYEIDRRSWECLAAIRKALSIFVSGAFVRASMTFNGLLVLAFTFTTLHVMFSPYENSHDELLDKMERLHLFIWVISAVLGAGSTDPYWGASGLALLVSMLIVILLHFLFVLYWMYTFLAIATGDFVDRLLAESKPGGLLHGAFDLTEFETAAGGCYKGPTECSKSFGRQVSFAQKAYVSAVAGPLRCISQRILSRVCDMRGKEVRIIYDVQKGIFVLLRGRFEEHACDKTNHNIDMLMDYGNGIYGQLHLSESDRRAVLAVVTEALEYVIVNLSFCTFSPTLLEFVLRYGFAFGPHGSCQANPAEPDLEDGVKIARHIENDAAHKRINGSVVSDLDYELKCVSAVQWMLDDCVFAHSLTVSELQDNLNSLMMMPAADVQVWLNVFEHYHKCRGVEHKSRDCEKALPTWAHALSERTVLHCSSSPVSERQQHDESLSSGVHTSPQRQAIDDDRRLASCPPLPLAVANENGEHALANEQALCRAYPEAVDENSTDAFSIGKLPHDEVSMQPMSPRCQLEESFDVVKQQTLSSEDESIIAAWRRMVIGAISIASRRAVWIAIRRACGVRGRESAIPSKTGGDIDQHASWAYVQKIDSCVPKKLTGATVQLAHTRALQGANIGQLADQAAGHQVEPPVPEDSLGLLARRNMCANTWNDNLGLVSNQLCECRSCQSKRALPKLDLQGMSQCHAHSEQILPYYTSTPTFGSDSVRARSHHSREDAVEAGGYPPPLGSFLPTRSGQRPRNRCEAKRVVLSCSRQDWYEPDVGAAEATPIHFMEGLQTKFSLKSEVLYGDLAPARPAE